VFSLNEYSLASFIDDAEMAELILFIEKYIKVPTTVSVSGERL